MADAVKRLADNVYLLFAARILTVLASTVGIGGVTWAAASIIDIRERQAVYDAEKITLRETVAEIKRDRITDQTYTRQLQDQVARIGEGVTAARKSLDRIEAFIDRQPNRP